MPTLARMSALFLGCWCLTACLRQHEVAPIADPAVPPADSANTAALTPEAISERAVKRRAVEAVVWGMPAVNFERMRDATHKLGGKDNEIVFWSRPSGWKNQTLTPNPDTIYLIPFFNTTDAGPVVLEIPPAQGGSITGSVDDAWQTAIEDVGPAGVDKGKGGKYLILPPGFKGPIPRGYIAMPSATFGTYALLRSNLASGSEADVAKSVAYAKRIKVYPLSQAANPPQTRFVDAIDSVFDGTIPYDASFYELLDRVVQREPWLDRDRVMIDPLRTIGIEKGKPFQPDAQARKRLDVAAREAHAWIDSRYESGHFPAPYIDGSRWTLPAPADLMKEIQSAYADPAQYPVDARGVTYSYAFFSAKHLGTGQFYLFNQKSADGEPLKGSGHYRLHVPANVPVRLYWSVTAYDRATHALIRDMPWASRSSLTPGLQKNADGSVDVYFGPKAPAGRDSNWVPTDPKGRFELIFRFYGPEAPVFDKSWKLPDVERA
ncbi:DUF1254 domain-containing protein [Lysobacter sp. S4-A87]|uniref:DUF1254 domain-containing protein n=1 Tax=Lysobacter sp. S4-A87 TaxID=2925843 RepID=UPI001F53D1DB|nr:DUF1254 domain-containing protein [Lysobacter sp. S4-A87]UNK50140.1 DUF1254 domain-containing protein [Lysobacter sp. S4-A87]